ncbi:MAG: SRPBCC domain-containing protein [Chitinophagales bacterium]|nr:SRPBCC domain-containing protein [Chitinophagales bacterium]
MNNQDFTTTILVDQKPKEVFNAINNVRQWWSEEIDGNTEKLNDEFTYHYKDVHSCKMKLIEVIPDEKVVWLVLDNYFSFTKDKSEWIGTKIIFEITQQDNKTKLHFTHEGLVPEYECYNACVNGWTQYIEHSLPDLITTGKGQPNGNEKANTIHEVAARFSELAQQEKWFEIQDELFADNVRSIDPPNSPYFAYAEGKANVRKKGEDWVKRIEAAHKRYTTEPIVAGNHFAVGREIDITVQGLGRIQINEIMIYEVKIGKIVSEQFFY